MDKIWSLLQTVLTVMCLLLLFSVVYPLVAFAAGDAPVATSSGGDPMQVLIAKYTNTLIAGLVTGIAAFGVKLWRWATKKTHIDENKLAMQVATQAWNRAEQLYKSKRISAAQRTPEALKWWNQQAAKKRLPKWVVELGEDFIEAAGGAINASKPTTSKMPLVASGSLSS